MKSPSRYLVVGRALLLETAAPSEDQCTRLGFRLPEPPQTAIGDSSGEGGAGLPQKPHLVKALPPPLLGRVLDVGWEAKGSRESDNRLTAFCVGSPLQPPWPVAGTQRHGGSLLLLL